MSTHVGESWLLRASQVSSNNQNRRCEKSVMETLSLSSHGAQPLPKAGPSVMALPERSQGQGGRRLWARAPSVVLYGLTEMF